METTFNNIAANKEMREEASFEAASEKIKSNGYRLHKQEHDKEGRDPKVYHTSEHLQAVERRADRMVQVLNLSQKQRAVTEIAAVWHDIVIEYDQADPNNLLAMIRRHRGAREGDKPNGSEGNECKSAQLAEQEMRSINKQAGCEVFTEEQIQTARWAIEATYPDVNLGGDFKGALFEEYPYYKIAVKQNPDLGKLLSELKDQGVAKGPLFFQPHLENPLENGQHVPREVLITALADLGTAGIDNKEEFFKDGDCEMSELYANLRRPEIIHRLAESDEDLDQDCREKITAGFLGWIDSQAGFAVWQSLRFEKIIYLLRHHGKISEEEKHGMRGLFSRYLDNIRASCDRSKKLKAQFEQIKAADQERAAFLNLARNMHYEI